MNKQIVKLKHTSVLTNQIVDQLKSKAVNVLRRNYLNPRNNQPMWVTHAKGNRYPTDYYLRNNCLPAHLSIVNDLKSLGLSPRVVVGFLHASDETESNIDLIKNFSLTSNDKSIDSLFHCWIEFDNSYEILDITSDCALKSKNGYLLNPLKNSHKAVLTDLASVYTFHSKFVFRCLYFTDPVIGRTENDVKKETESYLIDFSKQQCIKLEDSKGDFEKLLSGQECKGSLKDQCINLVFLFNDKLKNIWSFLSKIIDK
ncbi:hypothetical protein C4G28_RS23075 [Vibrio parahaemolyticus]|nr:hypothetical protein [Vibrio parahaemolyticus]EJG0791097.1 hypothetical protein [Vibrio parahaemolyticus]